MSIETPKGWQRLSLEETGTLSTSSVDKKRASSESEVFLVNYMDVYRQDFINHRSRLMQVTATNGEIQRSHICLGDVLFTPSSETPDDIGHAAVVIDDLPRTLHSYHTVRLRPSDRFAIFTRYLGYAFKNPGLKKHFEKRATGSTRFTLSLGDFRTGEFLLPPIEEQKLITRFLDTLDTQIRRTEEVIAKLEQVKQGLLTDLLTRGIDENGELRPSPEEAPELYNDSPLGWVPKGWSVEKLEDLVENSSPITYGVVQPGPHVEGGVPFLRGGDINRGRINIRDLRTISARVSRGYARTELRGGELVMSLVGYPGEVAVVPLTLARANIARQAALIRLAQDKSASFVASYLSSKAGKAQVLGRSLGSAQQVVNLSDLRKTMITIPPRCEQDLITDNLDYLRKRIDLEEEELEKLRSQKIGLMDDLLTGRVRVTPLLEQAEQATG